MARVPRAFDKGLKEISLFSQGPEVLRPRKFSNKRGSRREVPTDKMGARRRSSATNFDFDVRN